MDIVVIISAQNLKRQVFAYLHDVCSCYYLAWLFLYKLESKVMNSKCYQNGSVYREIFLVLWFNGVRMTRIKYVYTTYRVSHNVKGLLKHKLFQIRIVSSSSVIVASLIRFCKTKLSVCCHFEDVWIKPWNLFFILLSIAWWIVNINAKQKKSQNLSCILLCVIISIYVKLHFSKRYQVVLLKVEKRWGVSLSRNNVSLYQGHFSMLHPVII